MKKKMYYIANNEQNQRKEMLNLKDYMFPLFDFNMPLKTYRQSKIWHYDTIQNAYTKLLSLNSMSGPPEVKHLFYTNLMEDFDPIITRVFPNIKIYGVIHDTYFDENAYGNHEKNQEYETYILEVMEKGFVGAQYIYDILVERFPQYKNKLVPAFIPKLKEVSSPLLEYKVKTVNEHIDILWNHRVSKPKGYKFVIELANKLIEFGYDFTIHVCTTSWVPQCLKEFNDFAEEHPSKFKVHINPKNYEEIVEMCDVGFSSSEHDTFGGSVIECLANGMPYFVPDVRAGFIDFTHPNFRYPHGNVEELINLINIYGYYFGKEELNDMIGQLTVLKMFTVEAFIGIVEDKIGFELQRPGEPEGEEIKKIEDPDPWGDAF